MPVLGYSYDPPRGGLLDKRMQAVASILQPLLGAFVHHSRRGRSGRIRRPQFEGRRQILSGDLHYAHDAQMDDDDARFEK